MKMVIVYNPKSGSALTKTELRKKCAVAGIEVEAFVAIADGLERKLAPYIKKSASIAAVGGDGTVSAVAGLVANTNATLVPLPGGTLNNFTKDLGVSQDMDEALARLKKLRPRQIDIASVNDMFFINNSSMGIYPASLHTRDEIEPRLGKWPAAIVASFRALVRLKTYRVTIGEQTFTTPFIFVGNNRYSLDSFGGTERTTMDEGLMTVFAAKTQSRLTLLKIALFALFGKVKELSEFDEFHVRTLTIQTRHGELSVSHDGEVSRLSTPLQYETHAKALRVLA